VGVYGSGGAAPPLVWFLPVPYVCERVLLPLLIGRLDHPSGHVMDRPEVYVYPRLHGRDQGLSRRGLTGNGLLLSRSVRQALCRERGGPPQGL